MSKDHQPSLYAGAPALRPRGLAPTAMYLYIAAAWNLRWAFNTEQTYASARCVGASARLVSAFALILPAMLLWGLLTRSTCGWSALPAGLDDTAVNLLARRPRACSMRRLSARRSVAESNRHSYLDRGFLRYLQINTIYYFASSPSRS